MNPMYKPYGLAAIGFSIVASILFFLPGSALPSAGWMASLQIDKWVHVGIFFLLCFLWSNALAVQRPSSFLLLAVAALFYGCVVEGVQHNFVVNRSFDKYDVLADAVGIVLAFVWWRYIKK